MIVLIGRTNVLYRRTSVLHCRTKALQDMITVYAIKGLTGNYSIRRDLSWNQLLNSYFWSSA